jgi:hypothetical protein
MIQPVEVNLTVMLPLLEAACNEGRTESRELWARLLTAAMDPTRRKWVRRGFTPARRSSERATAPPPLTISELTWQQLTL